MGYTFNYAGDLTNDPAQENMRVYLDNFFKRPTPPRETA